MRRTVRTTLGGVVLVCFAVAATLVWAQPQPKKTGIEGELTWSLEQVDISAFAGEEITLFLEQDANEPGSHEQIYYDNVWIR